MTESTAFFALDERLSTSTAPVVDLPLSRVLLRDDSRFPWAILVPRRAGAVELSDLDKAERAVLIEEIVRVGGALRGIAPCDKLNIGAIGNIVPQLHVHVVARHVGDAAWPRTVWESSAAVAYPPELLRHRVEQLRAAIADDRGDQRVAVFD